MKYILGMAKSYFDLKGGRRAGLELDYLRLLYAVNDLRKHGESAQGYLVVLKPQIWKRVKKWESKYRSTDCVKVVVDESLAGDVEDRLKQEKARNKDGMVAGATGREVGGRSSASFGQQIGEDALRNTIASLEPNVKLLKDENKFPYGIRWDFCGSVD